MKFNHWLCDCGCGRQATGPAHHTSPPGWCSLYMPHQAARHFATEACLLAWAANRDTHPAVPA